MPESLFITYTREDGTQIVLRKDSIQDEIDSLYKIFGIDPQSYGAAQKAIRAAIFKTINDSTVPEYVDLNDSPSS